MNVLVVEDEPKVASFIKQGLEEQQNKVDVVSNGSSAQNYAINQNYDVIVLDLMLPDMSGVDVCKKLRNIGVDVPILMLTALSSTDDKLTGFDAGADDYLTKPFEFKELTARLKALSKRKNEIGNKYTITVGDLVLDYDSQVVRRAGKRLDLTHKEYTLLEYLMKHQNQVVTRNEIADKVWDIQFDTKTNVIDVYINFLRKKIDKDQEIKLIHTVVGLGYMIKEGK